MLVTRCFSIPLVALSWLSHRRMGADPKRFSERLGHSTEQEPDPVIWFHAASLGEVQQAVQLVQSLAQSETRKILVTTTTATGADWVAKELPYVTHRFAPLDTPAAVRRFLDGWSITAAIFLEGDLWPRLLSALHKRDVPRILLNARHSRTRARFPAVFGRLLSTFSAVTCRSELVAQEFRALGLPSERIHVLPDLRLTLPKLEAPHSVVEPLSDAIGTRPIWLAASTHPADEEAVLAAHLKVLDTCPDALLIIAPRHPNRRQPLQQLARSKSLTAARRSLDEKITATTQIYIADTLRELGIFYALSPIAFLGGSFGQEGGHNPYEPAHFETAIVFGPYVKNFTHAYEALQRAKAAVQVEDAEQLGQMITDLLRGDQGKTLGHAGLALIKKAQNSTLRYVELIKTTLP